MKLITFYEKSIYTEKILAIDLEDLTGYGTKVHSEILTQKEIVIPADKITELTKHRDKIFINGYKVSLETYERVIQELKETI